MTDECAYLDKRLARLRTELVLWWSGIVALSVLINHFWK
jgi:hypothetical protein